MDRDFLSSADGYRVQKTLKETIVLKGVGLHSGAQTRVELIPAPPNHGIVFRRTDLVGAANIPAHFHAVVSTHLATTLGRPETGEAHVATVEHVMAALYAMGITNLLVEVSGPEIPILDGSAGPYVEAIRDTGIQLQPFSQPTLKVLKPIRVYRNGTVCELLPRERLRLTTSVDFPHPEIGLQTFALDVSPRAFWEEVGNARTFGFLQDFEKLKSANLAQGASLENVLAFSAEGILNPEGARFPDECVRHKLLDALGDLALAGCWIQGELVSFRGGHSIHLTLLQALDENRANWEIQPAEPLERFRIAVPLR